MKHLSILLFIAFVSCTQYAMAQTDIQQQALDHVAEDELRPNIIATTDEGVILDMNINGSPAFVRLDGSLDTQWQKIVPYGSVVAASQNGGAVIVYLDGVQLWQPDSGYLAINIITLDDLGNEISAKRVQIELDVQDMDGAFAPAVIMSDDGRMYLAAASNIEEAYVYMAAIDPDGTVAWCKRIDGIVNASMVVDASGGCIVIGGSVTGTDGLLKVASFNAEGDLNYYRSYDLGATYPVNSQRAQWFNDQLYVFLDVDGAVGYMIIDVSGAPMEVHLYGLVPPAPINTTLWLSSGGVAPDGSIDLYGGYGGASAKMFIISIDPDGGLVNTTQFATVITDNIRRGFMFQNSAHGIAGGYVIGNYFEEDLIFSQTIITPFVWAVPAHQASALCGGGPSGAAHMPYPISQIDLTELSTIQDQDAYSEVTISNIGAETPFSNYPFCIVLDIRSVGFENTHLFDMPNNYIADGGVGQLYCKQTMQVDIIDLSGRRVFSKNVMPDEILFLPTEIAAGHYMVRGTAPNGSIQVKRFVLAD